jgi:hypothetical protein
VQVIGPADDLHTFTVLPRRWVVERTFAWISKHRRTTRDYEHLPASHEAMILWAMIALMTRRLAQPTQLSDAHLADVPGVAWAGEQTGPTAFDAAARRQVARSDAVDPSREMVDEVVAALPNPAG